MGQQQIGRVAVKHAALMNYVLLHRGQKSLAEIAQHFGCTRNWVSIVMNSDVFQAVLRERQREIGELVNVTVADRINGVAALGLEKLGEMMEHTHDPDFVLDVTDKLLQRAGYGSRAGPVVQVNNNTQVNNYIPVERNVLEECRQQMLAQAQRVQPQELPCAEESDIFDAVVRPLVSLSAPVTIQAGPERDVGRDSEE